MAVITCEACGEPAVPGHRFCGHCGAPLRSEEPPEQGERRPVTVLFCDIVGSTGLAERLGDEAAHRVLGRFVDIAVGEIERYGGTVDKFLGDGLLALIGVPRAFEDHAQRAVLAALGLRQRLRDAWPDDELGPPPQTRMGINTGTVVVGTLGVGRHVDHTAIGDAANVAARLQAAADPGDILVSDATAQRVGATARLAPLGALSLKGRTVPVVAHRLLGVGARRSPLDGVDRRDLTPFVGRDRELDGLREAVAVVRGGRGRAVSLVGEPGLGKSRLVLELRRDLGGEPVTFLEGRCVSFGATTPYGPLADIVRANAGIAADEAPDSTAGKVRLALAEVGMDAEALGAFVLHAIGAAADEGLDRLSPEAVRDGVFRTLLAMCLEGARRRPLVLAVEDLHWIDPTSEAFLGALATELEDARILLLGTHRPGYRPPWAELGWSSAITLQPLGRADSRRVVRAIIGPAAAETSVEDVILRRGEGNPFFLEELSRGIGAGADRWSAADVPESVQGVLMARIDRLDAEPRRVLQTASVLGRDFSPRLLGAVWRGSGELDHHLATLQRLDFVYESAGGGRPRWAFTHALTQDVAYGALLSDRRRSLHRAAAEALAELPEEAADGLDESLALHYSRAEMHEPAVRHLRAAAARSARRHAHEEASQALVLALDHVGRLGAEAPGSEALELTLQLADSLYFLGRFAESRERLDAVHERVGDADPGTAARFHFARGLVASHAGATEDAVRDADAAWSLAEAARDDRTLGLAEYVRCRETFWHSRLEEAIRHGERGASLLDAVGERWWEGQLRLFLNLAFAHAGDLGAALASIERGRTIGDELGDVRLQSYSQWNVALVEATRLETDRAIAAATRAVEMSPDPLNTAFSTGALGFALLEHGDPEGAIPWLEKSAGMLYRFGVLRTAGWMQGYLAEARLGAGDLRGAHAEASAALVTSRTTGHLWSAGRALRALGRTSLAGADLDDARDELAQALGTFESFGGHLDAAIVRVDLASLATAERDQSALSAHAERARDAFAALSAPRWVERLEAGASVPSAGSPSGMNGPTRG
jgi:class 3 adenylate cyclase/tetratricopeptide (TPR) repeat protein